MLDKGSQKFIITRSDQPAKIPVIHGKVILMFYPFIACNETESKIEYHIIMGVFIEWIRQARFRIPWWLGVKSWFTLILSITALPVLYAYSAHRCCGYENISLRSGCTDPYSWITDPDPRVQLRTGSGRIRILPRHVCGHWKKIRSSSIYGRY